MFISVLILDHTIYHIMKTLRHIALITIALIAIFSLAACGNSAEKLNNEGNEAYAQQAYEDALASYQSAQIENPELVEPHYNAANTLYRAGDYAGALEELQKALALADGGDESQPLEIAQASFFNAGNSSFNAQELDAAVDAYRRALLLNPDDLDAKYNLELALQQQQQEQQDQEQNQDQNQDQQNQDEQNQDQQDQENQDEQNQDQQQQDQQDQQQQDGDQQESDQQQDGQPQDEQQDEQQQDQQPGEGEPQPADEDPNGQPSYAPAPGERMSEEQAKQLLAAIAGGSDTLMERLNQILYVNQQPPKQDW